MKISTKFIARQLLVLTTSALLLSTLATRVHAQLSDPDNAAHYQDSFVELDDRAWINSVGTSLFADTDRDGFFSGISLNIDGDTAYSSFRVYAAIDIIALNNASTERLHTTRDFDLYGNSTADEYYVDIDLIRNYNPAEYDLIVSLADSSNNEIIDRVTARDFSSIQSLPLESQDNEDVFEPIIDRPEDYPNDDVRVVEYAGSTGFLAMTILLGSLFLRKISS